MKRPREGKCRKMLTGESRWRVLYSHQNNSMSEILHQEKYEIQGGKVMHKHIPHGIIYKSNKLKAVLNAQQEHNS